MPIFNGSDLDNEVMQNHVKPVTHISVDDYMISLINKAYSKASTLIRLYSISLQSDKFKYYLKLVHLLEDVTLKLRNLQYTMEISKSDENNTNEELQDSNLNIKVEFTPEMWLKITLPTLMQTHGKMGSSWYIRKPLRRVLEQFSYQYLKKNHKRLRLGNVVIAFVYCWPEYIKSKYCSEIDNYAKSETKGIIDDIALYALDDDGPFQCYRFFMAKRSNLPQTIIFVIPQNKFDSWYKNQHIKHKKR